MHPSPFGVASTQPSFSSFSRWEQSRQCSRYLPCTESSVKALRHSIRQRQSLQCMSPKERLKMREEKKNEEEQRKSASGVTQVKVMEMSSTHPEKEMEVVADRLAGSNVEMNAKTHMREIPFTSATATAAAASRRNGAVRRRRQVGKKNQKNKQPGERTQEP